MSPVTHDAVVGATTARQVVFVGPMGVGKTTAVTSLSDVPVVGTDVRQSTLSFTEVPQGGKTTTTVGIDDGEWTDPEGRRVALLGTPGQVRFSSARESVTAHRARIVLWVFGQRPDAAFQIGRWLELLGDESVWARTAVALTRLQGEHPRLIATAGAADGEAPAAPAGAPVEDVTPGRRPEAERSAPLVVRLGARRSARTAVSPPPSEVLPWQDCCTGSGSARPADPSWPSSPGSSRSPSRWARSSRSGAR